jgi:Ca2+-binding EF-hand superfamily protein
VHAFLLLSDRLTVRDNGLHNATVVALCRAVENHPSLSILDVSSNSNLSIDAGMALLTLAKKNPRIRRLGISKTRISKELQKKINDIVLQNQDSSGPPVHAHHQIIAPKEFFRAKAAFDELDNNMDGTVSAAEFVSKAGDKRLDERHRPLLLPPAQEAKKKGSQDETRNVYQTIDKDADGKIDLVEYMMVCFPHVSRRDVLYNLDINSTIQGTGERRRETTDLLSKEEKQEIAQIFHLWDDDRDGILTKSELRKGLLKSWVVADVEEVLKLVDKDNDDRISFEEFLTTMADYYKG